MTNIQPHNEVSTPLSAKDDAAKTNALIAYCLMAVGFLPAFFGLWVLFGLWLKKVMLQTLFMKTIIQTSSKYFGGALALALLAFS